MTHQAEGSQRTPEFDLDLFDSVELRLSTEAISHLQLMVAEYGDQAPIELAALAAAALLRAIEDAEQIDLPHDDLLDWIKARAASYHARLMKGETICP